MTWTPQEAAFLTKLLYQIAIKPTQPDALLTVQLIQAILKKLESA